IGKLYNENTVDPIPTELDPYIVLTKILENINNACYRDVEYIDIDIKNKYTMPKIGNGFLMSH
ncbi:MAG: hypothetical protein ACC707_15510, partial [Thiohalomonadales bacterium]